MSLSELAQQCERATIGRFGSETLNRAIGEATGVGGKPGRLHGKNFTVWPNFTSSLDAATKLVPEEWRIGFEDSAHCDEPGKVYSWCWPFESNYDPDWQLGQEGQQSNSDAEKGYASTRALAICAAALRARAASGMEAPSGDRRRQPGPEGGRPT